MNRLGMLSRFKSPSQNTRLKLDVCNTTASKQFTSSANNLALRKCRTDRKPETRRCPLGATCFNNPDQTCTNTSASLNQCRLLSDSSTDVKQDLQKKQRTKLEEEEEEDRAILPALQVMTEATLPMPHVVDIMPGKGRPPEPPVDCCMSGCANCVWIMYAEELREYFTGGEGNERARKAIETIDNPGLKAFLKLELRLN